MHQLRGIAERVLVAVRDPCCEVVRRSRVRRSNHAVALVEVRQANFEQEQVFAIVDQRVTDTRANGVAQFEVGDRVAKYTRRRQHVGLVGQVVVVLEATADAALG